MRRGRPDPELCSNYKCPHNLFWEVLGLNMDKIQITEKAREIGNCCRRIREPWTLGEIAEAWGFVEKRVKHVEECAWMKLHTRRFGEQTNQETFLSQ